MGWLEDEDVGTDHDQPVHPADACLPWGRTRPSGSNPSRAETREQLSKATYDLLVIGGGILGISTAWHAAQSGLRVALVDAGDFAGATSSASSKLLHGGLRYLQTGAVKLVAENHFERRAVSREVAPHLANPLTFYLPVYKGGPHGAAKLGAGVFAYSALSAFGDGVGHVISPGARPRGRARAAHREPQGRRRLRRRPDERLPDGADDGARGRRRRAPSSSTTPRSPGLRFTKGRVTGAELRDRLGRHRVRRRRPARAQRHRPVGRPPAPDGGPGRRAVHPAVQGRAPGPASAPSPWKAALATPIDKYRITFALPWEDMLLLGTTDEEYEGDPADVAVTEKDIAQILDEAAFSIRDQQLVPRPDHVRLRRVCGCCRAAPATPPKAKRETVVTEGRGGMLSVAGGKWTTFRHIGRTVMNKLADAARPPAGATTWSRSRALPKKLPLPGVANPNAVAHRLLVDGAAPGPRMAAGHRAAPGHPLRLAGLRHRPAGERGPGAGRARSTRTPRRSGRRSSTPATTSGPRPRTTCCAAARR